METNWNKADENGIINVPDELDGLINKVGMQFNFVQFSGKNQNQAICDIVKGCQDFFEKQTQWIDVNDRLPINKDGKHFLVMVKNVTGYDEDLAQWFNPECEDEPNRWQTYRNQHGRGYSFEVTHWMEIPELHSTSHTGGLAGN